MSYLPITWQPYDSIDADHTGFNLDSPTWKLFANLLSSTGIWASGDWHQYSANGVPVVAGEHFMRCSFRSWDDVLAAVWSSELNRDFSYMDGRLPSKPANWQWTGLSLLHQGLFRSLAR